MANGWAEEQLIISRRRRRGWTFECHNFYILAPKVDCRWLAKQDWWLSEASRVLIIFCEIPNKHFFDNKNQTTTTTTSTTTTTCDDLYRDSPHRKVKKDFKPKRDFVHKTYSLSLSLSLSLFVSSCVCRTREIALLHDTLGLLTMKTVKECLSLSLSWSHTLSLPRLLSLSLLSLAFSAYFCVHSGPLYSFSEPKMQQFPLSVSKYFFRSSFHLFPSFFSFILGHSYYIPPFNISAFLTHLKYSSLS